jgi:hypothetical protein
VVLAVDKGYIFKPHNLNSINVADFQKAAESFGLLKTPIPYCKSEMEKSKWSLHQEMQV